MAETSLFVFRTDPIRPPAEFDTTVVIGAGGKNFLHPFSPLQTRRCVLLEADADTAEQLRETDWDASEVEVLESLVLPKAAEREFFQFNFPFVNGPLREGELQTLYPRIRCLGSYPIPGISFSELLRSQSLDPGRSNCLILDVPGQEHALLASLSEEELQLFSWISTRCCKAPLQEGATTFSQTKLLLEERAFRGYGHDFSLPAWPWLVFFRDETQLQIGKWKRSHAEKSAELHAMSERLAQAETSLVEKIAEQETTRERLTNAERLLAEKEEALQTSGERLSNSESALAKKTAEQETTRERLGELERTLADKEAQLQAASEKLTQTESSLSEKEAQLQAAQKQLSETESKLGGELAQAKEKCGKLESAVRDRTSEIALMRGRSTKDRADLQELRKENQALRERQKLHGEQLEKTEVRLSLLHQLLESGLRS